MHPPSLSAVCIAKEIVFLRPGAYQDTIAIMLFQSTLSLVLVALSTAVAAAPVDVIAQGSKHNLYLVTCTRRSSNLPGCPLIIICPRQQTTKYTAVAYYANGPIESNRNVNPTQIATVAEPAAPWEGTQRVAKLGRAGDFSGNIDQTAAGISKGQIAGSAKLASEDFVCFKDGATSFTVRDELDDPKYSCTADYWCPSIQV